MTYGSTYARAGLIAIIPVSKNKIGPTKYQLLFVLSSRWRNRKGRFTHHVNNSKHVEVNIQLHSNEFLN